MSLSPHAQRLDSALRTHAGDDFADALLRGHPLSVSATPERKFRWAIGICDALTSLPPETARAIRRDCRCNDGRTMANQIAACIRKAGGLAEGCRLFTQTNPYAFLEYVADDELVFGYHACVCSCVKRSGGTLPRLWCECSCGYALAMFRQVFPGREVQLRLTGSVRGGDGRCEMWVQLL